MPFPQAVAGVWYVLLVANNPWPPVNSLWAALRRMGVKPTAGRLFVPTPFRGTAKRVEAMVNILMGELGMDAPVGTVELEDDGPEGIARAIEGVVAEARSQGAEVILDITPARKLQGIAALRRALELRVPSVVYTYLSDLEGADRPYIMLPIQLLRSYDFGGGGP